MSELRMTRGRVTALQVLLAVLVFGVPPGSQAAVPGGAHGGDLPPVTPSPLPAAQNLTSVPPGGQPGRGPGGVGGRLEKVPHPRHQGNRHGGAGRGQGGASSRVQRWAMAAWQWVQVLFKPSIFDSNFFLGYMIHQYRNR